MSRPVTLIYDDRHAPPAEIDAIIGATRFSDILRKRVTLGEEVRRAGVAGGAVDLFHIVDYRDARHLAELIESNQEDRIYFRLPSFLMPTVPGMLAVALEKSRYVIDSMLLASVFDDDIIAALTPGDVLPLLRARDAPALRDAALAVAASREAMIDHAGFVDLRRAEQFLRYMGDATETRHFNATVRVGAIFRKSSSDREKMAREYGFFHVVPEALKAFLLPTFEFQDDGTRASYAMERINVPDAALQFIHAAFDQASFDTLLDRFFAFVRARPSKAVGEQAVRQNATDTILGKMNARLGTFLGTEQGLQLDQVLAAAGPMGSLRAMQQRADTLIREAIRRDASASLAVGHGDPCFSNILFDRRIGLFRLIDPRGARTLDEAWMHPLYDLAKFSHSVNGGYDFVNNDLFDCALNDQLRLQLTLKDGGPPAWCQELLAERLRAEGHDAAIVRAYELSLFMSMLPLHSDRPRKLAGFALIACGIMQKLESLLP